MTPSSVLLVRACRALLSTRSGAWKGFWKAVDSRVADAVDDLRMLEVSRLDALQVPLWEKAMAGDVKAAMAVLRTSCIAAATRPDKPGAWKAEPETVVLSPAQLARGRQPKAGTRVPRSVSAWTL